MCLFIFPVLLVLTAVPGCTDVTDESPSEGGEIPLASGLSPDGSPRAALSAFSHVEVPQFTAQVPGYSLPLDLEADTLNWLQVEAEFFGFTPPDAKVLMSQNGFVVLGGIEENFAEPYETVKRLELPIFVTTDTVLHLYHAIFDYALCTVEEQAFYNDLRASSSAMTAAMMDTYGSESGDLREAAKLAAAFFAVGLKCLDPDAAVPPVVQTQVNTEIAMIEAHSGFGVSPVFGYMEDYSQFKPRGHYTRSETLEKYFKAMIWYGRFTMLLKGGPGCLVDEQTARIQTLAACIIAARMDEVLTPGGSVRRIWERLYAVTSFFVGAADDLTPHEYRLAIEEVCGAAFALASLDEKDNFQAIRAELAQMRRPEIYGGTGGVTLPPGCTKQDIDAVLAETQGMRFMGQRFVPDSYWFQNLLGLTYTGAGEPFTWGGDMRVFPRGLDVMNVLGSDRASQILHLEGDADYEIMDGGAVKTYDDIVADLRAEIAPMDEAAWNQNLYFGWLYSLKPLLKEHGTGYPTFMQTGAWTDKQLQTALASWTELRHDTILYAKQTSIGLGPGPPPPPPPVNAGYVEPNPDFYARLKNLCLMTKKGLAYFRILDAETRIKLDRLIDVLDRLLSISVRELENEILDPEDYTYINEFAATVEDTMIDDDDAVSTILVADVHTEAGMGLCLEEGVGRVDWIVVAFMLPTGDIQVGVGPVFSYYEFKHPASDRLTDGQWWNKVSYDPPDRPAWISSFSR